jgi:dephospho-CoA kinase
VTARVALTGGIATGKSHVRAVFESLGVPTIDSDVLARKAVEPSTPGFDAVVSRFGREVVAADGSLDRRKLGAIVFADQDARRALERIVHPEVRRATDDWFAQLQGAGAPFAIADIPLLYEVGRDRDFDAVIVAACSPALQLRRVMDRDDLSEDDARRRIASQLPIDEKRSRADYVIWTDLSYEETERQVRRVHQLLRDRYQRPRPT